MARTKPAARGTKSNKLPLSPGKLFKEESRTATAAAVSPRPRNTEASLYVLLMSTSVGRSQRRTARTRA